MWLGGEISTPILLLKDKLIGEEGGEEFLEEEKEQISFSSPEIPTKGNRGGGEILLGFVNFLRDFIPLYSCVVGLLKGLRTTKKINNDLWLSSGGKKAFDLAKKFCQGCQCCQTQIGAKSFL